MSWFNVVTKPTLAVIWLTCIAISILDICYVWKNNKNWSFYDNKLLESKIWWLCGIPLCVYSFVVEISLLILTLFSFKNQYSDLNIDELDKEYKNYNYSNLYDNIEDNNWQALSWIDNVGLWNRLVFIITNFMALMTMYYIYVGLVIFQTKSVTFWIKTCLIVFASILTWIPGVLNSFVENLKLFGVVSGCSLILILLLCSRNYHYGDKVSKLTSEVLSIKKLSKGEEIVNKRIIQRYIESGGKYYTISTSPAAIATELYWGEMAMNTLKENRSYFDCDFNANNNKWINCVHEKITSYPSWVIGDKTISGIVEPASIAHMVNINIKELKDEVLALVHPDEKKEIEKKISDIIPKYSIYEEDSRENDDDDKLSNKASNEYLLNIEKKNKKAPKKRSKDISEAEKREEEDELLIDAIYDQPSFRGINIMNKLEASEEEDKISDKNLIKEESKLVSDSNDEDEITMELPSKQEFNEFNDNIDSMEKKNIVEMQKAFEKADNKIDNIENEQELNNEILNGDVGVQEISDINSQASNYVQEKIIDEASKTHPENKETEEEINEQDLKAELSDDDNTEHGIVGEIIERSGTEPTRDSLNNVSENFASEMVQSDDENS